MASSSSECSICLNDLSSGCGRTVVTLQCSHTFHLDCIGSAFNARGAMECPICRANENGTWRRYSENHGFEQNLHFENQHEDYFPEPISMIPPGDPQSIWQWDPILSDYRFAVDPNGGIPNNHQPNDPSEVSEPTESPLRYGICDDCINHHLSSGHAGHSNGVSVPAGNLGIPSADVNAIPSDFIIPPAGFNGVQNDIRMPTATYTNEQEIIVVHHYYPQQRAASSVPENQVASEVQDEEEVSQAHTI
ncbi:uncharacterized protein LOC133708281 isoform X2 [Rosa rugosa]|uniref:uncharacterized protein LOC133708281 isoform X2 n=1 Tax=Rosa rugosa TaxID=74645 RepID=UPI002B407601|nr:uncharacterized protein LOC133708281 isoform X2 [Rosa rugosa]